MRQMAKKARAILFLTLPLLACGGADGGATIGPAPSNQARFLFDCDLQGVNGALRFDVEAVGTTGVVFGSGPNPSITGVIGTGNVTYLTSGEVVSSAARYIFTGENNFADFTDLQTSARFRVRWDNWDRGIIMTVNPFGPGPVQYPCVFRSAQYL